MTESAKPRNEIQRLRLLHSMQILDTKAEERFDRITRLVQRFFDVPICLLSLVDSDRQWFKSKQGLDVCETSREVSFCSHAIAADSILIVEDAQVDPRFEANPLVTGEPFIRFYAGCPITNADGLALGTLCIIDRKVRTFSQADIEALQDFTYLVEEELQLHASAITDGLTGLLNRRGFTQLAEKQLEILAAENSQFALLSFDLDGLKQINDSLGHLAGDEALTTFAQALLRVFPATDLIGRLGGDEFVVLANEVSAAEVTLLQQRLADEVARLNQQPNRAAASISFSQGVIGSSAAPQPWQLNQLLAHSDKAMYRNKQQRKDARC